jgi:hypothetical protein
MEIPVKDKSSYLKGLLIVARKDNRLAESEKEIIRQIALRLGFASDFYEDVLKSLLANKYILDDPIEFSNEKITSSFILDALKLVYSVDEITESKLEWLKEVAKVNKIEDEWFNEKLSKYKSFSKSFSATDFALYSII